MSEDQIAKYEFRRKIEELRSYRGRATELISLYVPPQRQISDVANYLRNEYAQSSNIKSRTTRKNVMWAIDSLIGKLKYFKRPPPSGMVFFTGTAALSGDQSKQVSYVIEPPEPINTYLYRCDSSFFLAPLEEILAEKENYGLLVIDRKEATIGILRGKRIVTIKNQHSLVPSKHGRGGQSQKRFERLIEIAAHEFYVKMSDIITEAFLGEKDLKGILVGGPGATKEYFIHEGYLHHELQKKVVPTLFDTGYTDEYGLKELVEKASDTLSNIRLVKEKKLIQRFMDEIKRGNGLAAYGESEVRGALKVGAVDTLLLSENLRKKRKRFVCESCKVTLEETVNDDEGRKCPKCSASMSIAGEKDVVEDLNQQAALSKTTLELISADSEEGKILLDAFGGIAAILRFRIGGG